jgi:hypothetical protein
MVSGPSTAGTEEIVFSGTLEQVDEHFREQGWSDGMAFTPPSMERVERFLEFTDLDHDHQIAVLRPGNVAATPLNVGANGVMAGCRPEHMPVLLAAVEALADHPFNLEQLGTTTGRHPFLVLNGPIVRQLGIETGTSATSRGPNPAIGRALGLIVRNIAGFRPGEQYMGTHGYFLPFVLGEDEELLAEFGWDPIHVEDGFDRDASVVSLGNTLNFGSQARETSGTDVEAILRLICREIVHEVNLMLSAYFPDEQLVTVIMTPGQAEEIAKAGYSRRDVETFLFEQSLTTIEEFEFELWAGNGGGTSTTLRALIDGGLSKCPREWLELDPSTQVPALCFPGQTRVVVAGNPTRSNVMVLYSAYTPKFSQREIRLPARWDELLATSRGRTFRQDAAESGGK